MNWNHQVRAIFEKNNWRMTLGVRQLVALLGEADRFCSAYELQKLLEKKTDVTTIYRILDKLQKARLIHEFQGKWKKCDHFQDPGDHHFLICDVCGEAQEVVLNYKTEISDQLAREKNFMLKKVHLGFLGTCENCHGA